MTPEYCNQALEKVGNANVLVNLVSRRVRQLNNGGGKGRPLLADCVNMGKADIALLELVENKMGWVIDESHPLHAEVNQPKAG